ncbi:MAG: SDR family oxidoreductase [Nitrososphaeria archaeon]
MTLQDKTVIITGGTHGIGEETALLFASRGARVLIIGRDENKASRIIAQSQGKIEFLKCDLSDREQVLKLCRTIEQKYDKVHVLINNASRNSRFNVLNLELDEWDKMIELNMTSVFLLTKTVASKMIKSGIKGKIINVGAVQSFFPLESSFAYSTVKGAMRSMTKSMAVDLAPYGILVTLVMPGPIYTKAESNEPGIDLDSRAATLVGRMGRKSEVAELLEFLSSDRNTFMTGNEIIIDGGRTISRKPDPAEITRGDI